MDKAVRIEEHLGLNGKNEMVWRNFIERSKSKNFLQTLPDYDGIEALCQWIINGSRGQF